MLKLDLNKLEKRKHPIDKVPTTSILNISEPLSYQSCHDTPQRDVQTLNLELVNVINPYDNLPSLQDVGTGRASNGLNKSIAGGFKKLDLLMDP